MQHGLLFENIFRDSKHGAALRHLPSGYPQVNTAWMRGALLAASMAAWLHQLTAATAYQAIPAGHGVRGSKAMIATLRRRLLISVPARPRTARRSPRQAAGTARPALTTGPEPRPPNMEPANPARHRATSLPAHRNHGHGDQQQP